MVEGKLKLSVSNSLLDGNALYRLVVSRQRLTVGVVMGLQSGVTIFVQSLAGYHVLVFMGQCPVG